MSLREEALFYAENNICILPLTPKTKIPEFKLLPQNSSGKAIWLPLAKNPATTKMVKSWFKEIPNINIGFITGNTNKFIVLDLDADYKIPFLTNIVQSGRTNDIGRHVYFSIKDSNTETVIKQKKSLPKIPNTDWKINNGISVAPPSIHKSGKIYHWMFGTSPQDIPMLPFSMEHLINFYKVNNLPLTGKNSTSQVERLSPTYTYTHNLSTWEVSNLQDTCNKDFADIMLISHNPDIVIQLFRCMGVDVSSLGQKFCCPLHPESNPSANLFQMKNGIITLSDFHATDHTERFWDIGEVYYHHKTGKAEKLEKAVQIKWMLRCFADYGAVTLPQITYKPLLEANSYTRQVYADFCLLMQITKLYDHTQDSTPFSWRFIQDWSSVSEFKAKSALIWLLDNKYIKKQKITGYKYTMYSLCQKEII